MVYYGEGQLGTRTISSDTTDRRTILAYSDLTVNSGSTYTVPSNAVLLVSGTLTVDGTIECQSFPAGGSGGNGGGTGDGGDGGAGGGTLVVAASQVAGSGTVAADAGDGANGSTGTKTGDYNSDGNAGGDGTPLTVPRADPPFEGDPAPGGATSGGSGAPTTMAAKPAGNFELALFLESWLESGHFVSKTPLQAINPPSGGGGGGADQGDDHAEGGSGGTGASFFAEGGNGGGSSDAGYNTGGADGGGGGGGGGAGGCVVAVSDSHSTSLTYAARGGDGGSGGGSTSNASDGGGGGGGSGGFVAVYADATPNFDLAGGSGGTSSGGENGSAGSEGVSHVKDVTELD